MSESTPKLFAFTLQNTAPLRSLLHTRQMQMLSCDHRAQTLVNLRRLEMEVMQLQTHLTGGHAKAAAACLHTIEVLGFANAAYALKGIDASAMSKEAFIARASQLLYALRHAFDLELGWYNDLAAERQ